MARIEVIMPQMGESITEGTIVKWHKKVGDQVKKDETLLEISTDKVDSEIPSPGTGVLAEIVIAEQQTVAVRTVIAYLEDRGAGRSRPSRRRLWKRRLCRHRLRLQNAATGKFDAPEVRPSGQGRFYSPLVMNIARTEGLPLEELERVPGTGEGGRVTKKDILSYLATRGKTPTVRTEESAATASTRRPPPEQPAPAQFGGNP